ncbi:unnamed protein product [Pieris brassicae]|uniref:LITAF domain-containing protein n=1 Tax=Pieris brassicae TaxID=7116 RepID=A0A9P0T3L3_PIEBR|nr:unnamed protein product [Pieris brassicae]
MNIAKMDNMTYQQITQSTNEVNIEMDLLQVGSEPVGMRCPHCHEEIMTRADYKNSSKTHLAALILGLLFWWLCCCILPYFLKRWKNVEHFCPNCRRFLGVYTRNKLF